MMVYHVYIVHSGDKTCSSTFMYSKQQYIATEILSQLVIHKQLTFPAYPIVPDKVELSHFFPP